MMDGWLEDVMKSNVYYSAFADLLIQNIHRWIVYESSKLYDSQLSLMMTKLVNKIFNYLLCKLKSFGI